RFSSRLADLTLGEREAVEALARGITAKLLHDPIVALKERSAPGAQGEHARVLAELLGIDDAERAGESERDEARPPSAGSSPSP
ncbi:MAG: hypothetical protein WD186_03675, partial [Actinomycetota bacterium]